MDNRKLRLMDANFNRGREAMRVMEDTARFILNDSSLSALLKQLRHDLCQCMKSLPWEGLLQNRDVVNDPGTTVTTSTEQSRADTFAIAQAAGRRLSEALRCLEEYSKLDSFSGSSPALLIEQIRYRAYTLEKELLLRLRPSDQLYERLKLYILLTEELCRLPILETVRQVLRGGASCIQLREKNKSDRQILTLAKEIIPLCRDADALFFLNDRPDLAMAAGADGVHLGQQDMTVSQARKILPSDAIVGVSVHTPEEAQSGLEQTPDYIAAGAVFASSTKPEVSTEGIDLIKAVREKTTLPLIAIGGISPKNAAEPVAAGASGLAVCQSVIASPVPAEVCRRLLKTMSRA